VRSLLTPIAAAFLFIAVARGGVVDSSFGSSRGGGAADPNSSNRSLEIPSSEEMEQAADLIITGKIKTVQDSLTTVVSPYQDPSPPAPPEHIMHAFVTVLHTFKGFTSEDEIDFRYRITDPNYGSTNQPNHARLEAGHRYRFFLKQDDSGHGYVGILDGKIDDVYDIQALGPDEADDQPYLKSKDALAMAQAFYASLKPPPITEVAHINGDCSDSLNEGGAHWTILYWPKDQKQDVVHIGIQNGKAYQEFFKTGQ
jgi:hypothetical protein